MNEPILAPDDRLDTLRLAEKTLSAADYDEPVAAHAQPRTYTALTERPAGFEGFFVPPRRQCAEAVPTYTALTERPAGFEGFMVPPRHQCAEQTLPKYQAPTEPPSGFTIEILFAPANPQRAARVPTYEAPMKQPMELPLAASAL